MPYHFEHFVLDDFKVIAVGGTAEGCVAGLAFGVFVRALAVVGGREVGVGIKTCVTTVANVKVSTTPKTRTPIRTAVYQILFAVGDHFLHEIQLQQKGPLFGVAKTLTVGHRVPLVMAVASDGFAELRADDGEGILHLVAYALKGLSLELVLGGPEDESELFGIVERTEDERVLL